MTTIQKGIFRHYKGGYYEVIDVARHSETLEDMVIYREIHDKATLWVRPFQMFFETIEIHGRKQSRFEFIKDKDPENNPL